MTKFGPTVPPAHQGHPVSVYAGKFLHRSGMGVEASNQYPKKLLHRAYGYSPQHDMPSDNPFNGRGGYRNRPAYTSNRKRSVKVLATIRCGGPKRTVGIPVFELVVAL